MKTRTLALILAALTALTALALAPSDAEIIYEDTFDEFNGEFWDTNTRFTIENGTLEGWDDAVVQQSYSNWNEPTWGAFDEFTAGVDVRIEPSAAEGPYSAGIWYTNIFDKINGYFDNVERYKLMYNAEDSTVVFSIDSERRIKGIGEDGVVAALRIDGEPGTNYNGEAVRLGIRVEKGKVSAFANGKFVGEHSYLNIGYALSPIILFNRGCLAAFDNFFVGDLDEDLKLLTRPENYVPEVYAITIEGGKAIYSEAIEGESVTVSANVPKDKRFEVWELVSGEGIDAEALSKPIFTFTMPACAISLKAVFADDAATVAPGDADGNGKINAKDVTAIMKHLIGKTPDNFVLDAADFDSNGKLNAKDVTALMKHLVTTA